MYRLDRDRGCHYFEKNGIYAAIDLSVSFEDAKKEAEDGFLRRAKRA